jgi:transcriptional regulator with XRE-family HTH domain
MQKKKLLGLRIKELRKRKGYSQEKLSELINVDPTTIGNIENGKNYPTLINLKNLTNVLNVTFLDVFDFEHKNECVNLIEKINFLLKQNPSKVEAFYKIIVALTK